MDNIMDTSVNNTNDYRFNSYHVFEKWISQDVRELYPVQLTAEYEFISDWSWKVSGGYNIW